MPATQAELDAWLGTSPADRAELREGRLPRQLRRFLGGGCLSLVAVPFGVAVGAGVASAAGDAGLVRDVPALTLVGCGAAAGGAVAYALVRGWFAARQVRSAVAPAGLAVRSEFVEVAGVERGASWALVTASGRRYRLLLAPGDLELTGRFRVFYVDPGDARTDATAVPGEPMVVALEVA